jgi:hypothetical protein
MASCVWQCTLALGSISSPNRALPLGDLSEKRKPYAAASLSWGITPGGLHEKMLTEIGEQAKTVTLPPPQEGQPDMAEMEKIMETARKYDTELLPPSGQ